MVSPSTPEELGEALRTGGPWRIEGLGTKRALCLDNDSHATPLSTLALAGLVDWAPDDQVVVVRAGTPIAGLQRELSSRGHCLPMPDPDEVGLLAAGVPGTVGGLVAMNVPHALQGPCGGARDWVLGLTIVRPDGAIAKCGSRVVKNVAGYDVQKLMIGARGTLGVVAEVVLRTFPLRARPAPELVGQGTPDVERAWIQRTLRTDFAKAAAAAADRPFRADEATSTLWSATGAEDLPPRFAEDWALAPGLAPLPEGPARQWMHRVKAVFDPEARLNPGAMEAW